ncbi:septation protein A [Sphingomonas morindae]|uniref:Inner membrane-spanning protein YciB n=1 Tax=Sphingomonas morindae TaxID=1541170 RepID=A0ABY4X824_9SPHN|nr:septation protein A [Sphingomonas morindae]USI73083.1 septation protein A [Sphingomonas morindae]
MTHSKAASPLLRIVLDFGPILLFFLANAWAPVAEGQRVYVATGAFMAATVLAMIVSKLRLGQVSPMLWVSGAMVLVFGALTLWLRNDVFIKVKPTIYYVTVATILFVGLWRRRPTLKLVFGAAYPGLSERGWHLVSRNWAWFFVVMAIANEVAWRHLSTSAWIGYKLWGVLPATMLFALANVPMMMRHGLGGGAAEAVEESPPSG